MSDRYDDGTYEVFCLTDGASRFGLDVFPDLTQARCDDLLMAAGETEIRTEFNAYLIRQGDQLTLVDTGCGALFGPNCGRLPQLLAELSVAPSDISRLIFTHLHGDHCGGALRDGLPAFTNAKVFLHTDEAAYWQGKDAPAARTLTAYGDQITLVGDGQPLGGGLTTWALPGHTPGHMGLRLGDKLVLVGDIFHALALQIPDPLIWTKYDVDPVTALASRQTALAQIADHGWVFAGGHSVGPHKFMRLNRAAYVANANNIPNSQTNALQ
jgi:glyoxylase-like metal-dependent hydrolase (beta-lactamase superfamily II)